MENSAEAGQGDWFPWSEEEAEPPSGPAPLRREPGTGQCSFAGSDRGHGDHRPAPSAAEMDCFHNARAQGPDVMGTALYERRFCVLGGLDQVPSVSSAS